jgi:recombinational DNA repair ATPase RecF
MYERLSGERRQLSAQLVFGAKRRRDFRDELTASLSLDRRVGFTTVGPHRDDLFIETGGHTIRTALSRGQLRTLVIALKVLTHAYTKKVTQEEPLLLLDDVLSELDEVRQEALLSNLPTTQMLLTCTAVPHTLRKRSDVFLLDVRTIVDTARAKPDRPVVEPEEAAEKVVAKADVTEETVPVAVA